MQYDGSPEDAFYAEDNRGRRLRLIPQHPEQVADALERLATELERTKTDLRAWKWAIVALHSALQNAMADVVQHEGSTLPKDLREIVEEMERGFAVENVLVGSDEYLRALARRIKADEPTGFLQDFTLLWKTTKTVRNIEAGTEEDTAIRRLNRERNKFVHLGGEIANFDLRDYPAITLTSLTILEFLGWKDSYMNWFNGERDRARKALDQCLALAKELVSDYA